VTGYVLDASALLAVVRQEPGGEYVAKRMTGASMCTVNAGEAVMRGVEKGYPLELIHSLIVAEEIDLVAFDWDLALAAARLRPATSKSGLSFADRACLALAIREGAVVLTADRVWSKLDLPCPVEVIR